MKTPVSDSPDTQTENHPAHSRGSDDRIQVADVTPLPINPGPNAGPASITSVRAASDNPKVKYLPPRVYEGFLSRLMDRKP